MNDINLEGNFTGLSDETNPLMGTTEDKEHQMLQLCSQFCDAYDMQWFLSEAKRMTEYQDNGQRVKALAVYKQWKADHFGTWNTITKEMEFDEERATPFVPIEGYNWVMIQDSNNSKLEEVVSPVFMVNGRQEVEYKANKWVGGQWYHADDNASYSLIPGYIGDDMDHGWIAISTRLHGTFQEKVSGTPLGQPTQYVGVEKDYYAKSAMLKLNAHVDPCEWMDEFINLNYQITDGYTEWEDNRTIAYEADLAAEAESVKNLMERK
jgi:hypothetical protein